MAVGTGVSFSSDLRSAKDRYPQLLERCYSAFDVFDYRRLANLKAETAIFLSAEGGQEDKFAELARCHKKLALYLDYYRLNIVAKGKSLLDWNYYRLIFDSISAVDQRRVLIDTDANSSSANTGNAANYYELLYRESMQSLRYAASYYQHHFPFIDWTIAAEDQQRFEHAGQGGWESLDMFMTALAKEVGELNHRHAKVRAARKVSISTLRRAQRELLNAYDALMQTPFRAVLIPYISSVDTTKWRDIKVPSAAKVHKTLLAINRMFEERLALLKNLYETSPMEDFAHYLIKNQSQAFAEFMVNYPEFFNINNHHLDLIDLQDQRRGHSVPVMHYVALVSSILGITLAALHEVSTPKTTSLLYFFSVVGGLGATVYLAVDDKSLVRVLPLRKQLAELRTSMLLGQSNAYRYLISRNSSYKTVRDKALIQSVLFGSYAVLMLRGLSQLKTIKVIGGLDDPTTAYRQILSQVKQPYFKGLDMVEIDKIMHNHAHPERLAFQKRMQILDSIFKHRHQSYTQWRKNLSNIQNAQDLSPESIKTLYAIGEEIAGKFDPLDAKTIKIFMQQMGVEERIATLNLERIRNYMLKIFQVQRRSYVQTF